MSERLDATDIRALIAQTEMMIGLVRAGVVVIDAEARAGQFIMLGRLRALLADVERMALS